MTIRARTVIPITCLAAALLTPAPAASRPAPDIAQQVKVELTSRPLPQVRTAGRSWWEWTIDLTGPQSALHRIRCVRYTLPSTFAEPVHLVCGHQQGTKEFLLTGRASKAFTVHVELLMQRGNTPAKVALYPYRVQFTASHP